MAKDTKAEPTEGGTTDRKGVIKGIVDDLRSISADLAVLRDDPASTPIVQRDIQVAINNVDSAAVTIGTVNVEEGVEVS